LLGGDFQALGAARSLAVRNVPVVLVDDEPNIARFSNRLADRIRFKALHDPLKFSEGLIALARQEGLKGWMLLPNDDELVKLLAINKDALSEWFIVPVPSWSIVRKYYYKNEAYELARRISVPVPTIYSGRTIEDILALRPAFPLVLKPSSKERYYPLARKKAIRVDTAAELRREYQDMSAIIKPEEIIVQEFLPGGGKNLYSYAAFYDGHKIAAGMAANRIRQHPPEFGHATTFAMSVNIPELKALSERLFREIGFYGIAEVEFMWDERQHTYKFIEINGRIWGWHTLALAAGINFPYILFEHLMGLEIELQTPRVGVKWVRLITDVPTCVKEILSGSMTVNDYAHSMSGPKEFAVFSFGDPLPFFTEFFLIPYLWWKRGF